MLFLVKFSFFTSLVDTLSAWVKLRFYVIDDQGGGIHTAKYNNILFTITIRASIFCFEHKVIFQEARLIFIVDFDLILYKPQQ